MDGSSIIQRSASQLRAARVLLGNDRQQGLASLHRLFRHGRLPDPPPAGRYRGEFIVLNIAPGLTQFFQWLAEQWMPWRGKTFDPAQKRGDNIFARDSYLVARFFNPFYRGFSNDGPQTYRGFTFQTYVAPGVFDTDRTVLKIDYNLKENPSLTVRRVLDELVQLDEDLYLGKAHVCWWWGTWQLVAYFSLTPAAVSFPP